MGIFFNGDQPEKCEFYQGKRIDQAYLIRKENQRAALERKYERLAEMERQKKIAEAQAQAEAQSNSSGKFFKSMALGLGAGMAGSAIGMNTDQAFEFGEAIGKDNLYGGTSHMSALNDKWDAEIKSNKTASSNSSTTINAEQQTQHCAGDPMMTKYKNKISGCQPCANCAAYALAKCYYEATGNPKYKSDMDYNRKVILGYDVNECPDLVK